MDRPLFIQGSIFSKKFIHEKIKLIMQKTISTLKEAEKIAEPFFTKDIDKVYVTEDKHVFHEGSEKFLENHCKLSKVKYFPVTKEGAIDPVDLKKKEEKEKKISDAKLMITFAEEALTKAESEEEKQSAQLALDKAKEELEDLLEDPTPEGQKGKGKKKKQNEE